MHPGTPPSRRDPADMDWRKRARLGALFLVNGLRQLRKYNGPEIREKVIMAAREALSPAPGGPMYKPVQVPNPDGSGTRPDYIVSSPGVFRLVLVEFDLDWSDAVAAESFMAEIQAVLDEELAA